MNNFIELKQRIIDTINKDGKNAEELLDIMSWGLDKVRRLVQIQELEDLRNECNLNSFESEHC